MIIAAQLAMLILALAFLGLMSVRRHATPQEGVSFTFFPLGTFIGVAVLIAAIFITMSVGQINAGSRGVVLRFGAVTGRTLGEGIYFVTPLSDSVEVMDLQIRKYEEPWSAGSKDLQEVQTTVALNYRLIPEQVDEVYRTLNRDYLDRVIVPAVGESIKSTTAKFNADELLTQRSAVKAGIEDALRERLAKSGIYMEAVSITHFQFSETFQRAIEAKQVAVQKAFEAENRLVQIKVEAEQAEAAAQGRRDAAIKEAEGRKDSAILDASGEAQAILEVANAQAQANELINSTLTDQVIQYTLVQELAEDIDVMILPGGQPFILGEGLLGKGK